MLAIRAGHVVITVLKELEGIGLEFLVLFGVKGSKMPLNGRNRKHEPSNPYDEASQGDKSDWEWALKHRA